MKEDKQTVRLTVLVFALFTILFLLSSLEVFAQRIEYVYDDSGNRTTRQKEILVQTRNVLDDGEETSPVYEESLSESKVTIYPNPTRGMLQIDISGIEQFENSRISLYDITGQLLQQWSNISQSNMIDISDRSPGMCIMQIAYNGKVSSWKIIKE